jgi:hypothetical protein
MFRSDAQKCQAIRVLLKSLSLGYLWTERGPTAKAIEWLDGSPLSSGRECPAARGFRVLEPAGKGHARPRLAQCARFRALREGFYARAGGALGRAEAVDDWIEGELNQTPIRWARDIERVGQRNEEMHTALIELVSAVQDAQHRQAAGDPNAIEWNAIAATMKRAIKAIIHYR